MRSTPNCIVKDFKPRCPKKVIPGHEITKSVRKTMVGGECRGNNSIKSEILQREFIRDGTGVPCAKTNLRINLREYKMNEMSFPNKKENGFDYTEDFDGIQIIQNGWKILYNFKSIVGKGGSQTRSLREVYSFVEGQLECAKKKEYEHYLFANILDGDEANRTMDKFHYLLQLYPETNAKVFVGDMKSYFAWLSKHSSHL